MFLSKNVSNSFLNSPYIELTVGQCLYGTPLFLRTFHLTQRKTLSGHFILAPVKFLE